VKKKRVVESIRRFYGAIQSATFFWKKKHFFLKFIFLLLQMRWLFKKCRKKPWCSFFWGQNGPEKIFEFSEKSRKNRKKCVFFGKKAYGLSSIFTQSRVSIYHAKMRKKCLKKKRKKKRFSFFETFFLKWKLDIYFCPFLKLKKKFWKLKNFPFSPSRWIIRWDGEWTGEFSSIIKKIIKRSSKNAKWVFARRKTRIGLFEDLLVIFLTFSGIFSFYFCAPFEKNEYFRCIHRKEGYKKRVVWA
jgi:hypothetical protein